MKQSCACLQGCSKCKNSDSDGVCKLTGYRYVPCKACAVEKYGCFKFIPIKKK